MANIMTKSGSQDNILTYEHICDTTADMANIERRYKTLGSTCIVITGESGGLEVYIADQNGEWKAFESAGSGGFLTPALSLHICTEEEVDEGMPNIAVPEENTIYFVPTSEEENNLYTEYIYVDGEWEKLGGAALDLTGYATENYVTTAIGNIDLSTKADKANTVLDNTLSINRKANSTVGALSIAVGWDNTASGTMSVAEGSSTIASGAQSHAEGVGGQFSIGNTNYTSGATGPQSHSEGNMTLASGDASHTEGYQTRATQMYTHAEGYQTLASGQLSHAEGQSTTASSTATHAEGSATTASGTFSHAEGYGTLASGQMSHAEGFGGTYTRSRVTYTSEAKGNSDHTEGYQTRTGGGAPGNHAEGNQTAATGGASHAEGSETTASGNSSHAEGNGTIASGVSSHAEGSATTAAGVNSHAEGDRTSTTASGTCSHAEGFQTTASGPQSHAEGQGGTFTINSVQYSSGATGANAHSEGLQTLAGGPASHAEGQYTIAGGPLSHTEGQQTTAISTAAHAEGFNTVAKGLMSHAEGVGTIANGQGQHSSGMYNIADSYDNWTAWTANTAYKIGDKVKVTTTVNNESITKGYICKTAHPSSSTFSTTNWNEDTKMNYAVIVGGGTDTNNRKNIYTLDWDGTGTLAKSLKISEYSSATGMYSLAIAPGANATGIASFALGSGATASGTNSLAIGSDATASGSYSFAIGGGATASAYCSTALGTAVQASGDYSFAEGGGTIASSNCAHAEGSRTVASGAQSHAEGSYTQALAAVSHAEGDSTIAKGSKSHVSGKYNVIDNLETWPEWATGTEYEVGDKVKRTVTSGNQTIVSGYICIRDHTGYSTFALDEEWEPLYERNFVTIVGNGTADNARSNAYALDWNGNGYFKGDVYVKANANSTGGNKLITQTGVTNLINSSLENYALKNNPSFTGGISLNNLGTLGSDSVSFGYYNTASGGCALAQGSDCQATNSNSSAMGHFAQATGECAHAVGKSTIAAGANSHVSGRYNVADTVESYPEWTAGTSYEVGDIVIRYYYTTPLYYICLEANSDTEYDHTKWGPANNVTDMHYALIVGNGTANNVRSNAYALDWDGNGHYMGDVYVGANADSSGGNKLATEAYVTSALANAGGSVSDVQIDGTSILSSGVANIPMASYQNKGVVKVSSDYGITLNNNGYLTFNTGNDPTTKLGGSYNHAVLVGSQHVSTFYGLAKVAGVDLAQSGVDAD